MARKPSPVLPVIVAAIEQVERYGLPMTPANVQQNVDLDSVTLGDLNDTLRRHITAQIPAVMKQRGLIIADVETRERMDFWAAGVPALKEQRLIRETSADFDRARLACDDAVIAFLEEQEKVFGYEVYPGLFHAEIDRIYAMHSLAAPGVREPA